MNAPVRHPYQKKLDRTLDRMGGLYHASDLLAAVQAGNMQMFALNDSIVVTEVAIYPRARVLEVIAAVGNLDELRDIHDRILEFASDRNIGLVQAYGRGGWLPDAAKRGWRNKARGFLYQRNM